MLSGTRQERNATGAVVVRGRGRAIAVVGVALVLAASILRQLAAPRMQLPHAAQFLEVPSASGFAKPAIMFASLLTELLALTAVSRAMERRRVAVPTIALTTACLAIAVMLGFGLATWAAHDLTHMHQISRVMAHQYRDAVGPWSVFLGVLQCTGHSA